MYFWNILFCWPVHSLLPGVPGGWLWNFFSTHCDCWFTVIVVCISWKTSTGRSAMSCLWAEAGHKSIIFYPSCSIQNILSVHSMTWRQLIHSKFMEDCFLHTRIISRLLRFQTIDPSIPFHQRRKTSISASCIKFLVGAEPADSFVQKHIKYLKQTLATFVSFYLLLSSNKKISMCNVLKFMFLTFFAICAHGNLFH